MWSREQLDHAQAGMPWFCRTLPQEVSEDIEVRLCSDEPHTGEDTYIELLKLYVCIVVT